MWHGDLNSSHRQDLKPGLSVSQFQHHSAATFFSLSKIAHVAKLLIYFGSSDVFINNVHLAFI